jgi:hypothetical protein
MNILLWVRRFAIVFVVAFVVITGSQLLRGRAVEFALFHGSLWSAISTAVFLAAQAHRERKRQRCAVCDAIDGTTRDGNRTTP